MTGVRWLVLFASACGRIGFDAVTGSSATPPDGTPPRESTCNTLPEICGPTGTTSCCGSPLVAAGGYSRSYDRAPDFMFPDQTNSAEVSDFRLDTYEVTVGRFRQFVDAGMGTRQRPPAAGDGGRMLNGAPGTGGWDPAWNAMLESDTTALKAALACYIEFFSWTDQAGANEALPINCLTWAEAFAFCAWDGGFLPTEAEWNYVAAGSTLQRAYPWSNPPGSLAIDCTHANYYNGSYACGNPPNGGVIRVGSKSPAGDGGSGQADLGGNVWEWTLDAYDPTYINPCRDCANLTTSINRVIRGGSFYFTGVTNPRVGVRGAHSGRDFQVGVRCARPAG